MRLLAINSRISWNYSFTSSLTLARHWSFWAFSFFKATNLEEYLSKIVSYLALNSGTVLLIFSNSLGTFYTILFMAFNSFSNSLIYLNCSSVSPSLWVYRSSFYFLPSSSRAKHTEQVSYSITGSSNVLICSTVCLELMDLAASVSSYCFFNELYRFLHLANCSQQDWFSLQRRIFLVSYILNMSCNFSYYFCFASSAISQLRFSLARDIFI